MSFFSYLNPTPTFPAYSGPYQVGSHDVEIPTAQLSSEVTPPDPQVTTVQFRLFYPCQDDEKSQGSIRWLPDDQFEYLKAYYAFMQAKPWLNSVLTWASLLRLIQFATIPAKRDGKILEGPRANGGRWPVMIFSHGLGGSRNAYSHICGSLASHGLVVVAPEHRDGSAPLSFVRDGNKGAPTRIPYQHYPHVSTPEVEKGRNDQLKIRCWELGLIHDALLKIDVGHAAPPGKAWEGVLEAFKSQLDVHRPGKICWSGHSFGASTIVQFVKSVYHSGSFLFPQPSGSLKEQIQPASPISLLDLWAMPLSGPTTSSLYKTPLPAYCGKPASPPLAILSIGFYKWTTNFTHTLSTICPPSSSDVLPRIFYPSSSAHLSQSDFGVLFPWVTKKVMKAEEPERTLKLNTRAILESLRCSGIIVANTSDADMEMGESKDNNGGDSEDAPVHDQAILAADGKVRGWIPLDVDAERKRLGIGIGNTMTNGEVKQPADAVVKYEIMNQSDGDEIKS